MGRRSVRLLKSAVVMAVLGIAASVAFGSGVFLRLLYPIFHSDLIKAHADQHGLDPFLVAAVIRTESRFRENAVSSKGARGLMQIMPDTGRWASAQMGIEAYDDDMLLDPEVNIRIGAWYMSYLLSLFNHDEVIAIAAYNGGPANVEKWLDSGDWSGRIEDAGSIPFAETARYLSRVTSAYQVYCRAYGSHWPAGAGCRPGALAAMTLMRRVCGIINIEWKSSGGYMAP